DIKEDFYKVLEPLKPEIPEFYKHLLDGKIDGSTYHGECACLVGTFANIKRISTDQLVVKPDSSRPIERFFLSIRKGDTPDNNQVSAVVRDWLVEFCKQHEIA